MAVNLLSVARFIFDMNQVQLNPVTKYSLKKFNCTKLKNK